MPGLLCHMFIEMFEERNFDRRNLADFVLTILSSYRNNPYHNAEHAFCFTHTLFLILINNNAYFDFVEVSTLILSTINFTYCKTLHAN